MKRILVIATGAALLSWASPEPASLTKVWAEVVFSNNVLVDTGHPGSFELEKVSPAKLAHLHHTYPMTVSAVTAIDDHPLQPRERDRTLCGMCMDRSPGFEEHSLTSRRADELRTATRIDHYDLRLQNRRGLRVPPLFFLLWL